MSETRSWSDIPLRIPDSGQNMVVIFILGLPDIWGIDVPLTHPLPEKPAEEHALHHPFDKLLWVSLVAQSLKHLPAMQETWVQSSPVLENDLVAQTVKRLPATRETQVRSLGQEDPLEKAMATHSSPLAWKIPWMEEPGGLQSMGPQRVGHD